MHKGLQAAMKDSVIEKETKDLLKKFESTGGKDCDPQEVVRAIFGNILSFVVSPDVFSSHDKTNKNDLCAQRRLRSAWASALVAALGRY